MTKRPVGKLSHRAGRRPFAAVAFSRDGRQIAAADRLDGRRLERAGWSTTGRVRPSARRKGARCRIPARWQSGRHGGRVGSCSRLAGFFGRPKGGAHRTHGCPSGCRFQPGRPFPGHGGGRRHGSRLGRQDTEDNGGTRGAHRIGARRVCSPGRPSDRDRRRRRNLAPLDVAEPGRFRTRDPKPEAGEGHRFQPQRPTAGNGQRGPDSTVVEPRIAVPHTPAWTQGCARRLGRKRHVQPGWLPHPHRWGRRDGQGLEYRHGGASGHGRHRRGAPRPYRRLVTGRRPTW